MECNIVNPEKTDTKCYTVITKKVDNKSANLRFIFFVSEGTIEFSSYDRALSSSQISGQNSFQTQTFTSSSPNSQLTQSNEEL